jgi:TonB family protein
MATPWEDSVRCDHCQDKTVGEGEGRFCAFCGRQLPVREENPVESATAALDDLIETSTAPSIDTPSAAPHSARCESCGGPAGDADLCDACQRAFHAVIEHKKPETPVQQAEAEAGEDEFDEEFEDEFEDAFPEPSAEASQSVAPPPVPFPGPAMPVVAPFNPWAPSPSFAHPSEAHAAAAPPSHAPVVSAASAFSAPVVPEIAPAGFAPLPPPAAPAVAAAPPAPSLQPAPPQPAAPPVATQPVPARELTRPMPRPRPVPPGGLPNASTKPSSSSGRTRALFVAGALVVVALAVCVPLGQPWLASAQPEPTPTEEPPQEAPAPVVVARHTPPPRPAAVVQEVKPVPEPRRPVRPPKPARQEPKREAVAAPAVEAVPETSIPAPEPVAAPAPAPEPDAAPVGPFFETRQVNEVPQIASRIEPRLPDEVQGPINDVVIVRLLVSQTGHVSVVNVLRRSRIGVAVDDAVVAAVKRWTFSPARKKGEPVSCWYHVGVPIQRTN